MTCFLFLFVFLIANDFICSFWPLFVLFVSGFNFPQFFSSFFPKNSQGSNEETTFVLYLNCLFLHKDKIRGHIF